MAISLVSAIPCSSKGEHNNASVHSREYAINNQHHSDNSRAGRARGLWGRCQDLVRYKRHPQRGHTGPNHNVLDYQPRRPISTRSSRKVSGDHRDHRYRPHHKHYFYYHVTVCLLSMIVGLPVRAEEGTNNVSNPTAAATSNNTNQSVQFNNNGAPSRQHYGPNNISCNGPTMTFSPFYMGNDTTPVDPEGYVISENWGLQLNFMVPLDSESVDLCKTLARHQSEKMRLDYELVRALKCAELQQKGFTLRPGSRVEHMCNDVIPISALRTPQ